MKNGMPAAVLAATLLAAPLPGIAQQPAADPHGHDAKAATSAAKPESPAQAMRTMDEHMKKMQSLHERMARASTREERQKLMEEARNEMHEGMASMGPMMQGGAMGGRGMGAKGAPADAGTRMQMMEKRMDMMQMMMQMMMDRQESMMPAAPGATKP
jgi:hypothetical protein